MKMTARRLLPSTVRFGWLCVWFAVCSAEALAAITYSGDVLPAIPPSGALSGSLVTIGAATDGAVQMGDGSILTSMRGIVGRDATAHGTATVSGTGSAWNV